MRVGVGIRGGGLTEIDGDEFERRCDDGCVKCLKSKGEEQAEDDSESVFAPAFLLGQFFGCFFGFCVIWVGVTWRCS